MFKIDDEPKAYNPFFGCGCDVPPHEPPHHEPLFHREPPAFPPAHHKPRYTMTEEMEHTMRLARETIERLCRFEERVKREIADLSRNLTSDNVMFKETMYNSWQTFNMEVKNEINVFEATIEADIQMFKAQIESDYATLSEDVRNQIAENEKFFTEKMDAFITKYEQDFAELKTNLQAQYNSFVGLVNSRIDQHNQVMAQAFADYQQKLNTELNTFEQTMTANFTEFTESVATTIHEFKTTWEQIITERLATQDGRISDAEMYMKTNLAATVTTLIGDMQANGEFSEIIQGEVFNDLQRKVDGLGYISILYFGAHGDGEFDNTEAFTAAAACSRANGAIIYIPKGVYLVEGDIEVGSNVTMRGAEGAVIRRKSNDLNTYHVFNISDAENVAFDNLTIEGDRYLHEGTTGQHGICVNIERSKNVSLTRCHISRGWGDGVLVGGTEEKPSENVTLMGCVIEDNRRNGVSFIGGVKHSGVYDCAVMNNGGTAPSLGIDLEPWQQNLWNDGITISGCQFADNGNGDLTAFEYNRNIDVKDNVFEKAVSVKVNDAYVSVQDAHPDNIRFTGNTFNYSLYMYRALYGTVNIHNNTFDAGKIMFEHTANLKADEAKALPAKTISGNIFTRSGVAISIGNNANILVTGNIANDCKTFFEGYGLFNTSVKSNIVNGYNVDNDAEWVFRLNGICSNVKIEGNEVNATPESNDVTNMLSVGGGSVTNCFLQYNNFYNAVFEKIAAFGAINDNLCWQNTTPDYVNITEALPAASKKFAGMIVNYLREGVPTAMLCAADGNTYTWKPVSAA